MIIKVRIERIKGGIEGRYGVRPNFTGLCRRRHKYATVMAIFFVSQTITSDHSHGDRQIALSPVMKALVRSLARSFSHRVIGKRRARM
jgi:hypothetical protein